MTGPRHADRWESGDPYERFIGRWSRQVAPPFVAWLDIPPGRRWLDVGCGTGALSATILERCAPAAVVGVEPSEAFLSTAREQLGDRVTLQAGSATALPLEAAAADVTVSALVLNFLAAPEAALAEMTRVTAPGGTISAYVWDYAGRMELLRSFWDAAVALDPAAADQDEGRRFPLCRPDALAGLFGRCGLRGVATTAIDVATSFEDFDDLWRPFLGGQGPAGAYAAALDESSRARLRDHLRHLVPVRGDGSISLVARAWAVRGTAPR